jgi:hypothetical protein
MLAHFKISLVLPENAEMFIISTITGYCRLKITCHNVDFAQPSYESRCPVDILIIGHLSKSQDIGKFLLITYEGKDY